MPEPTTWTAASWARVRVPAMPSSRSSLPSWSATATTTGVDLYGTIDAAQQDLAPLLRRPQVIDGTSLILGYAGVYSSFLLHAERAAKRYDVDARDLLIELGRRKVVGGQEDMIEAVALEMIAAREAAAREADAAGVN